MCELHRVKEPYFIRGYGYTADMKCFRALSPLTSFCCMISMTSSRAKTDANSYWFLPCAASNAAQLVIMLASVVVGLHRKHTLYALFYSALITYLRSVHLLQSPSLFRYEKVRAFFFSSSYNSDQPARCQAL